MTRGPFSMEPRWVTEGPAMKQRRMDETVCVLICMGGKCEKNGGAKLEKKLLRRLEEENLSGRVYICPTQCMNACGKGPHAIVFPGGQHFREAGGKDVEEVLSAVKAALEQRESLPV